MKTIVLFDMDGTLTPPREKLSPSMSRCLSRLQTAGIEIGIVTGSDLNYLEEQCELLFEFGGPDITQIHFLPCNGTKYYRFDRQWQLVKKVDMIENIGKDSYKNLLSRCMRLQQKCVDTTVDLEYTGNFFDYRGSVLNWCPIGRSCTKEQRKQFVRYDNHTNLRENYLKILRNESKEYGFDNCTFALGGESSFDIYPNGWDKTFALQYFKDYDVFFVGDRCHPNGNDYTIYEACKDKGFKTDGPETTKKIIQKLISGT